MKKLFTKQFDICGNSFYRVVKLCGINKMFPIGNFKQGPGLRPAFTLLVLHFLGRPLFWFGVRYERYLHRIHRFIKSGR